MVKVGPVPKDAGVQIVPPAYAYSAQRGMRRVLLDLKSDGGRGRPSYASLQTPTW